MLYSNMTSTAIFLSCTPPPMYQTLPVTQTTYTTVYETVMPAACETSQWMTTYTVTETHTGNPTNYVTPTMPQGFVVTTVVCPGCNPTQIEVTQPAAPTVTYTPSVSTATSNGVMTTVTVTPTAAPSMGSSAAYPTRTEKVKSSMTAAPVMSSMSSVPVMSSMISVPVMSSMISVPVKSGYSSAAPSYPVPSSCSGSGCSSPGSVVVPKPGPAYNGTSTSPPPAIVTAGAASLKNTFELFSGLALLAFLL